ncbi:hypothetical protein EB093_02700 [bacterium]|nr:hypothetical protein [bacterium]
MTLHGVPGISAGSISMGLKLQQVESNMSGKDLGINLSNSVKQLVSAMRNEINSNFSGASLGKVNDLFGKFFHQLNEHRPDLLLDLIDDARFNSLNATMGDTFTPTISPESSRRHDEEMAMASQLTAYHFNISVISASRVDSKTFAIDGQSLVAAGRGDKSAIDSLRQSVSELAADKGVRSGNADTTTQRSPQSSTDQSKSEDAIGITISESLLQHLRHGDPKAIDDLIRQALDTVESTTPPQESAASNSMVAAIIRYRELLSKPMNDTTFGNDTELLSSVVTIALSKGAVEWANKASENQNQKDPNSKRQESIQQIIKKIQAHLSDGLDGLDELSELRGLLMSVDGIIEACPGLMDDLKVAFNEFMSQQSGNLDKNSAEQLLRQANEIISSATGETLFSESEIAAISESIGQLNPTFDAKGSAISTHSTGLSDQRIVTPNEPSAIGSPQAFSSMVPKPVSLTHLMAPSTGTSYGISETSSLSGDTSSDRQNSQSRISQIIDFLDRIFTESIDQALDKVLLGFETKHLLPGSRTVDPFKSDTSPSTQLASDLF